MGRRSDTSDSRFGLIILSLCLLNIANAQTQIHKCTGADGGVEYSQLPCTPEKPADLQETEPDAGAESASPVSEEKELPADEFAKDEPELESDSSACQKRYRDEIDAIDAEISREYSPDKAEDYKQRLLLLTRKLRQC